MRCYKCGFENASERRFCLECGATLLACSRCGHARPARAKFCAECGAALVSPRAADERRQITVVFCDLAGSTTLSSRLDPEELRDVIRDYQSQCAEVVERFGGSIVQYLGDGVLAYFGVPAAHEDDPRRAGNAGLEIVAAMRDTNARWAPKVGVEIAVRVGIHTGPVVMGQVGGGERTEHLAIGETPNIAARLQSCAEPNTVVASEASWRLMSRFFRSSELGDKTFSGVPTPIRVYQLIGGSERPTRPRPPALVGRERETAALLDCWRDARGGAAQFVLLRGEAGIGKSALVEYLQEHVWADDGAVLEGDCSPYYQNSPFYAVTELLARWLEFAPSDTPEERRQKLEAALATLRLAEPAATPLLASLLSLPFNATHSVFALPAALQRERTLALLLDIPRALAELGPVMLLFEDLHWADPSSREYFKRCVNEYASSRLLMAMTARAEFNPDWRERATLVELGGLDAARAKEFVARTAGNKSLPAVLVRQIVERSDGIPLFLEETTRAILESGALSEAKTLRAPDLVPMSLQDALMARLDRLGAAKSSLQLGATIGREFSYELLRAISEEGDAVLREHLERGVSSGLLQQHGTPPQEVFVFKHSLVRDTAYQSLLRRTRQQYHRRIAEALEGRFREIVETRPELLAYHHMAAGNALSAIPYWQSAGDQAIARAAFAEAIGHLSEGLRLGETLGQGPLRDRLELALQSSLGIALQADRGYAAPEVDRAYQRARELCVRLGDSAQLISVLRGQQLFYHVRADFEAGRQIARQLLEAAERNGNAEHRLEAHLALGLNALYRGEFPDSRAHLETSIALYEAGGGSFSSFEYLGHSVAMCHSYLARALWFMGHIDDASRHSLAALDLARSFGIPMTITQASAMHGLLFHVRRDARAALEWAKKTGAYAREHGFPYWSSLAAVLEAWAIWDLGDREQGLAQYSQSLEAYVATGAKIGFSWLLTLLGDMLARSGQIEEGLARLEEASAHIQATGERYCASEVERLKGELLIMRGPAAYEAAEACFQDALKIARGQEAKSWELRAGNGLARLFVVQGRNAAAVSLLDPVYAAFREAPDDPDVREARRLVEQASTSGPTCAKA
ncbi:MAG TPA: adenylate/guanylate cyclase domain-containing protein [Bryobacteraceae bacterium]